MEDKQTVYALFQTFDTTQILTPEPESPDIILKNPSEDPEVRYEALKKKYVKLYKEHNFLLKTIIGTNPPSVNSQTMKTLREEIEVMKKQIAQQQGEIIQKNQELENLAKKFILAKSEINTKNEEIDKLHNYIQTLVNKKTNCGNTIRNPCHRRGLRSVSISSFLETSVETLEIGSDLCLINFLVHSLLLDKKIPRDELLQYRTALNNIELKFNELKDKLNLVY
ncbi:hypothetical protein SteCoe_31718 [Stentor coeruleus]|uniref:Uncharacterized protein n=1 Tax=Stentor coeruleus TaxID=5963 RepID=A0A1R2B0Q5_9CILI|nr:hypothetical protein SteCoe_31718 [Stentor coeruleus]